MMFTTTSKVAIVRQRARLTRRRYTHCVPDITITGEQYKRRCHCTHIEDSTCVCLYISAHPNQCTRSRPLHLQQHYGVMHGGRMSQSIMHAIVCVSVKYR
jgi:hypothetical protein